MFSEVKHLLFSVDMLDDMNLSSNMVAKNKMFFYATHSSLFPLKPATNDFKTSCYRSQVVGAEQFPVKRDICMDKNKNSSYQFLAFNASFDGPDIWLLL